MKHRGPWGLRIRMMRARKGKQSERPGGVIREPDTGGKEV